MIDCNNHCPYIARRMNAQEAWEQYCICDTCHIEQLEKAEARIKELEKRVEDMEFERHEGGRFD